MTDTLRAQLDATDWGWAKHDEAALHQLEARIAKMVELKGARVGK